jgi:fructokinase
MSDHPGSSGPPTVSSISSPLYGGIEAGGTKWVCGVGHGTDQLVSQEVFPTADPGRTLARAIAFFRAHEPLDAIGIGSFGPIDRRPESPTWGHITSTAKPGWRNTNVVGALESQLAVPVAFDTDVNAALVAESLWGAGRDVADLAYITVGTGIGAGMLAGGRLIHGTAHPEFGHMRIPRDDSRDDFAGVCPFHNDCLEGLASGPALYARWGMKPELIKDVHAWEIEAEYLALGVVNLIMLLSPLLVIIGGGVTKHRGLLPGVSEHVVRLLAGYLAPSLEQAILAGNYLVQPTLEDRAGVLGAIALARQMSEQNACSAAMGCST